MADLKKKFIDILFEDDAEEEEIADEIPSEERKSIAAANAKKNIEESPIKAKDILYRKSSTSPFVNLTETKKPSPVVKEEFTKEEYEMTSQISPIFGLLQENKDEKITVVSNLNETQTNKPTDSHLDIITSPIYGYSSGDSLPQDNNDQVREDEEEELHHLFDEEESLNVSYDTLSQKPEEGSDEISLFRLFGENK